jgi:hypothetical protein
MQMDGHVLAHIVQGLGAEIVDDRTFSLPVSKVREVLPKLNELGIGCHKVQEFASTYSGKAQNIVHLRAYSKDR